MKVETIKKLEKAIRRLSECQKEIDNIEEKKKSLEKLKEDKIRLIAEVKQLSNEE